MKASLPYIAYALLGAVVSFATREVCEKATADQPVGKACKRIVQQLAEGKAAGWRVAGPGVYSDTLTVIPSAGLFPPVIKTAAGDSLGGHFNRTERRLISEAAQAFLDRCKADTLRRLAEEDEPTKQVDKKADKDDARLPVLVRPHIVLPVPIIQP